jgi:hypothetical protein
MSHLSRGRAATVSRPPGASRALTRSIRCSYTLECGAVRAAGAAGAGGCAVHRSAVRIDVDTKWWSLCVRMWVD